MLSRVKDVSLEDHRELKPIEGYERVPSMSLERAVQPLITLFPPDSLLQMVREAKGRRKDPADSLSPDESASIMLYTMGWPVPEQSLYYILNKTLREVDRTPLEPWFSYLKLLIEALLQLPAINDIVYRGVKKNFSDELQAGSTTIWWGFSSCSDNLQTLQSDLLFGVAGPRTMLHIKCLAGRNIRRHSYYASENEVLLLPGRYLKMIGQYTANDELQIIQMEETEPPRDLLKLPPAKPWRCVKPGISLIGACPNPTCDAYRKEVIIPIGFQGYDIVADSSFLSKCPMCGAYVNVSKLGFNHCHWSLHGIKQISPVSPPEPFFQESKQAPRYSMVEYNLKQNQTTWRQFIAEVRAINS